MKNFIRALKDARGYWKTLVVALLCSLGVATLWGANIAAMGPVIEVTLHGESLQSWNQTRITQFEKQLTKAEEAVVQAEAALQAAADDQKKHATDTLKAAQAQVGYEHKLLLSAKWLQSMLEKYAPTDPFTTVMLIVGLIVSGTMLKHVIQLTNVMLVSYVSNHIARKIRIQLFDKAIHLDRTTFSQTGSSGYISQITHTTEMLSNGITNFFGSAILEPLKMFSCLFFACFISWRLMLASLICAPLVAFLIVWLNRRIKSIYRRILHRSVGFHHVMLEAFTSIMTVQANTMEKHEAERFKASTKEMLKTSLLSVFYNSLTAPITELLGVGMISTAIMVGAYLVINQATDILGVRMTDRPLSATSMMIFFGMLLGASDPVRKLAGVISSVNTGMVAANMLYPMLDGKSRLTEAEHPKTAPAPHHVLEFRQVSFAYDNHEPTLTDVNLKVPFGSRIAIVGPNGGGKSTLMNLLCRFYDPQEGEITLDGINIKELAIADIRGRIGLVNQQTELFNESILYNIRYGRWDATDEEVIAAAKKAYAHDFISTFPEKYETIVGQNGQRLSGGQRQRIALARAILRNTEILILDEATSQIDVDSERLIHDTLSTLGRDRTMIMITHRTSTLELADTIVRVERGQVTTEESKVLSRVA